MNTAVLNKVIELIKKETGLHNVTGESSLFDDLEMSSLEVFSVFAELEEVFHIKLTEKMIGEIVTVEDIATVVDKIMKDMSE